MKLDGSSKSRSKYANASKSNGIGGQARSRYVKVSATILTESQRTFRINWMTYRLRHRRRRTLTSEMWDDVTNFVTSHKAWITDAGLGLGWLWTYLKGRSERRKLRLEVEKIVGDQLDKLHERDRAHRDSDGRYGECSHAFSAAVDEKPVDPAKLADTRNKLCRALNDLIHSYISYFDFYCHVYKDDSRRLTLFLDCTIRDIRIWGRCQSNLNHVRVLERLPGHPEQFKVSKHTLMPLRHSVSQLRVGRDAKDALNRELDDLLQAGIQ